MFEHGKRVHFCAFQVCMAGAGAVEAAAGGHNEVSGVGRSHAGGRWGGVPEAGVVELEAIAPPPPAAEVSTAPYRGHLVDFQHAGCRSTA